MPLDTGELATEKRAGDGADTFLIENFAPTLEQGAHIGEALKAAREYRGFSLDELAEMTRVRRVYLQAVEEMRLDALPSRPFTVGYIRAYARALGLDGDLAAARFKAAGPVTEAPLAAPVGVEKKRDDRLTFLIVGGLVMLGAIVAWNVFRRAAPDKDAPAPAEAVAEAPVAPAAPVAVGGPVSLGAPLPAPVESTTPTPYETPGLAAATAAGGSADAAIAAQKAAAASPKPAPAPEPSAPRTFIQDGEIFGAPASAGGVIIQATKPGLIVVRGADESVYFARQLNVGEAFRAPAVAGLVIDVSDPAAFEVYAGGQSRGPLPATQTPLSKLTPPKPPAPKTAAPKPVTTAAAAASAPASPPAPAAPARP